MGPIGVDHAHLVSERLSLLQDAKITDEVHVGWTRHADLEALAAAPVTS
jgi:hypothetical protein